MVFKVSTTANPLMKMLALLISGTVPTTVFIVKKFASNQFSADIKGC